MKLYEKIENIIKISEKPFEIIKGLYFNHREAIDRIYCYKNDKFYKCEDEDALFWNVVKPYVMHYAKNIDLDTKDFRAIGKGDTNFYQSWALNIRFNKWADDNNFSIKIDDLTQLISEFGSYVWKLKKNKEKENDIFPCDLRNLYFDPSVEDIRETDIVEKHYLTENYIRDKNGIWKNTEEVIKTKDKKEQSEFDRIEVWEFTGYDDETKSYRHVVGNGYGENCLILFEEEIDKNDNKYFDFHLDKYSGRWLRIGNYETNFILQRRANTLINENAEATNIASLLLLESTNPEARGNIFKSVRSGQILPQGLKQIAIENRAVSVLLGELDRIEAQVRKNLMLPDVATGDQLPSGITFRGQALMNNAYKTAFKQTRNRIAEPLKDIVSKYVLPSLIEKWNKEEMIEITENISDIQSYDEAIKTQRKIDYVKEKNLAGEPVQPGELEALDRNTEQQIGKVGRKLGTGKDFFNFEYGFMIDPVGETYDKAQQNDAIIQAITLTAQNPTISEIPAFMQLLENNGIASFRLKPEQKQEIISNNNPQIMRSPQETQTPETGMPQL